MFLFWTLWQHLFMPYTEEDLDKCNDITRLREHLCQLLATYEQAKAITTRERIAVERHLALFPEQQYQSYKTIGKELQVTASRVGGIVHKAMRRLRRQPAFVQALNTYLKLAPYPSRGKHPSWMNEQGFFEEHPSWMSEQGAPTSR